MASFGTIKTKRFPISKSILYLFAAAAAAGVLILGTNLLAKRNQAQEAESLNSALNRCISSCYALEGIYPPSLEYMEEHYGLLYDKDTFYVDYTPIGGNLYPDVTVIIRSED